jgi:hypothetical protein
MPLALASLQFGRLGRQIGNPLGLFADVEGVGSVFEALPSLVKVLEEGLNAEETRVVGIDDGVVVVGHVDVFWYS